MPHWHLALFLHIKAKLVPSPCLGQVCLASPSTEDGRDGTRS